jgi:dienelactone hydrolase
MPDRQLDTLRFTRDLYAATSRSHAFQAQTIEAARLWQESLSSRLVTLLGGFPTSRCDLRAEVVERRELREGMRETILFQSRENLTVFGYLLLPKEARRPSPVIVCIPGHGRGADDIVGLAEDGSQRDQPGGYQNDIALQAVAHGYAAFAIEPFGFGHRRDERARSGGAGNSSCQPSAGAALLFGQTMVGWRTWDVIRTIDYLQTRSEVDSHRIGCMGISGGGTITLFATALEPRIRVGVVSGYFNRFADSIMSISHCIDNYVPGIVNVCEMADIAGLIPPRCLFVESGTRDDIFPIAATRAAVADAKRIFACFGTPERIAFEEFEGEHKFWGKGAFSFLGHWL